MNTPANLLRVVCSALLFSVLAATSAPAETTVTAQALAEQMKVTPLPFPALKPGSFSSLPLEEIQSRADMLALTLGSYPPQFKTPEDRQGAYAVWSQVLAAAWEVQASQGDTEPVLHVLAQLYSQGHNLDVTDSAAKAQAVLTQGLAKFPDSQPLNHDAAAFYLGVGNAAPAERALLHLRALRHTTTDPRIERPLLFAYLYQNKRADALRQVEHCLSLDPKDSFYLKIKETLAGQGLLRLRVPLGAPNEVTLRGNPTLHFALDRAYETMEINPKDDAEKKDIRAYIFAPADGQSAANLSLGADVTFKTEASIAKMFEGAKVTRVKGVFNEEPIEVWRYRDSHHLYSTWWVTATDATGVSKRIQIDVIANSQERLEALEKAFSVMDILWQAPAKK